MTATDVHASEHTPRGLHSGDTAQLRLLLVAERERQLTLAAEHEATATELLGNPDVDSILERELAVSGAARASTVLSDIDAAIRRIDDGTYGICEVCGVSIPRPRLDAIPHARRCAACA
jgi:RNA polymerase-binding transcription factor DksA